MAAWNDFNDAEEQQDFDLIPKGTVARLRMTIKPGGFNDPSQGWVGGYATRNPDTGSIYLSCEFVVLEGDYAKRKLFSNIGLHSAKGETWGRMGRAFIRAVLNSARNIPPQDMSAQAVVARRIRDLRELDGIEFVSRIDVEKNAQGESRNVVRYAIEPGQAEYVHQPVHKPAQTHDQAAARPIQTAGKAGSKPESKPDWAQ